MREQVWRWLSERPVLRRMYGKGLLGNAMRWTSFLLFPKRWHALVRVESGLGKGLTLDVYPRWERELWEGSYETEVQGALDHLLFPGIVFFDIGGGIGFYSSCAARRGARVFVFEPDEANADRLASHLRLNDLTSQVILERKVVAAQSGTARILRSSPRGLPGNATVNIAAGEVVPAISLDDYCRSNPVPDLCKIDVEGSESLVLQGAENLFSARRTHLICEVHDSTNAQFLESWFGSKGYRLEWLSSAKSFPRILRASPNMGSLGGASG